MKIENLKIRIDELVSLAGAVLATKYTHYEDEYLSTEVFSEFRTASLSFLRNVFGEGHPFYKDFHNKVKDCDPYMAEIGRGILNAAKKEIDGGWLVTVKGLVSAEIFSDFLEMVEHLLQEGYKDPAAVMAGSVLEEHLRQLCNREGVPFEDEKSDKVSPKKADRLNNDLASAGVYNKLDQKSVTSWLDLRNKAAHGKYTEYTKEQVELMYQGVANFISRTSK